MEKVKFNCYYDGYSIKANYVVELKFFIPSSGLSDVLNVLGFVGVPVRMKAKVNGKPLYLGEYNLFKFSVDNDGETKVVFRSEKDSVNPDSFSGLLEDEAVITLLLASAGEA